MEHIDEHWGWFVDTDLEYNYITPIVLHLEIDEEYQYYTSNRKTQSSSPRMAPSKKITPIVWLTNLLAYLMYFIKWM